MWDNLKLHQDKVQPCYVLWNVHCKLGSGGSQDVQRMCWRRWTRFRMSSSRVPYLHVNDPEPIGVMHNSGGDVLLVLLQQQAASALAGWLAGWLSQADGSSV